MPLGLCIAGRCRRTWWHDEKEAGVSYALCCCCCWGDNIRWWTAATYISRHQRGCGGRRTIAHNGRLIARNSVIITPPWASITPSNDNGINYQRALALAAAHASYFARIARQSVSINRVAISVSPRGVCCKIMFTRCTSNQQRQNHVIGGRKKTSACASGVARFQAATRTALAPPTLSRLSISNISAWRVNALTNASRIASMAHSSHRHKAANMATAAAAHRHATHAETSRQATT